MFISCSEGFEVNDLGFVRCNGEMTLHENSTVINPEFADTELNAQDLVEAFGAGLLVIVPLYAALWGVRAAVTALKSS